MLVMSSGVKASFVTTRRRSAIEPVIGHMKTDRHLGRCYLKDESVTPPTRCTVSVGYNPRLVLAWLRMILRFIHMPCSDLTSQPLLTSALNGRLTDQPC
jgi:hypothetical protein